MSVPRSLHCVVQGSGFGKVSKGYPYTCLPTNRLWLYLAILLLSLSSFLASCSSLSAGNGTGNVNSGQTEVPLGQIHWCGKPLTIFRDEGATAPVSATVTATTVGSTPTIATTATPTASPAQVTTLSDWSQIEPKLGFTVYLPMTLPKSTCLVSTSGTLHDPIFGSSFTIGYLLANHSSISLTEAPLRAQSREFQCTSNSTASSSTSNSKPGTPTVGPGPTQADLQLCSGVRESTSIVFSAGGSTQQLQQFFNALQPHINWVPVS